MLDINIQFDILISRKTKQHQLKQARLRGLLWIRHNIRVYIFLEIIFE